MSRTFYTADTHFYHKNIIKIERRPFADSEVMTKEMIYIWNQQVGVNDKVKHMGDFALTSFNKTVDVLEQVNGDITLVGGNHDEEKIWLRILKERPELLSMYHEVGFKQRVDKDWFWFTHYPAEIGLRLNKWSIHGHIHGEESTYLNQINVGVDSPHFKHKPFGTLLTFEDIMEVVEQRRSLIGATRT